MAEVITVALVGNPNTGKSTLFTALSGVRQHVGNYPGVTVEVNYAGTTDLAATILEEGDASPALHATRPARPRNTLLWASRSRPR